MADTESELKWLWESALDRLSGADLERERKALRARWREVLRRKARGELTDDGRLREVERVVAEGMQWAGVAAPVVREPRDDRRYWTVGAAYEPEASGVGEGRWDKAVAAINAELREAGLVGPDALFNGWVTGADQRRRKVAAWKVDVWVWDGPPEGRGRGR